MGLWDRLTGKRKKTLEENASEARRTHLRDETEKQAIAVQQRQICVALEQKAKTTRQQYSAVQSELQENVRQLYKNAVENKLSEQEAFKAKRRKMRERPRRRSKARDGPSFDM